MTYTAVIYTDDGDRKFDFRADTLLDGASSTFTAK